MHLKPQKPGGIFNIAIMVMGFLMFASMLYQPQPTKSQGEQFSGKPEDVPFSTARIFSKIIEKTGLNPSADWTRTFGEDNDKDVGKDLYLTIYERTQNAPQKQAFKAVASKYGITEGDLVLITQNDFTPLLQKKSTLTQDDLIRKVEEIKLKLEDERDFQQLEADIRAAVEPSEIFANGDLDDSGFDLIHDLQMLEYLLFMKSSPIDIGGAYDPTNDSSSSSASGSGLPGIGGIGGNPSVGVNGNVTLGSQNIPFGQNIRLNDIKKEVEEKTGTSSSAINNSNSVNQNSSVQALNSGVNPVTCVAGDSFEKAFQKFEAEKKNNSALKDNSHTSGQAGKTNNEQNDNSNSQAGQNQNSEQTGTSSQALTNQEDFLPPKLETVISGNPAKADEWLQDEPCNDIFCLDVQITKKPATSSYQDADNCIACHTEKLNDTLKKVITHTLVPSKAPGNLAESAKCKKAMATAFGSVNMNFYAVAMPVQTPKNDDLIYGTNIEDDWENFCQVTSFFPFAECKKPTASAQESSYEIPPSIVNTITQKELSNASDETTLEDLNRNIGIALQGYITQRDQEIADLQLAKEAGEKTTLYNALKVELDQMNYYFFLMRDILKSLHQKIDSMPGMQACTEINNKKECS